jgi:hypothetical protein
LLIEIRQVFFDEHLNVLCFFDMKISEHFGFNPLIDSIAPLSVGVPARDIE